VHPFDWSLLRRALGAMFAATAVAAVVIVSTDEPGSTPGMRVARLAALSPLLVATAVLGVAAQARARGELGALAALGDPPWRGARGAAVAGLLFAAASVALLLSPWADVTSLFPAVHPPIDWRLDPGGQVARAAFAVVSADGAIAIARTATPLPEHGLPSWAALPCLAPIAAAVPGWAVSPMSRTARAASVTVTAALAVALLHLIAAGRLSPLWACGAVVPLLAATARARF
jgi:hypothetical protein